jgi:hypothetical protein
MKPKRAPWTEAENERLKAFVAQGASTIRAAAALNRTMTSVHLQARRLGSPFPPKMAYRKKLAGAASISGTR